jgi:hypothetical protein
MRLRIRFVYHIGREKIPLFYRYTIGRVYAHLAIWRFGIAIALR